MKLLISIARLSWAAPSLLAFAVVPPATAADEYLDGHFRAGYGFVSTRDNPGRAAEYTYLHSSPTAAVELRGGREKQHFALDVDYRNEADYLGAVHLDYQGLLRLDLGLESLFHNLDHLPAAAPQRPDAFKPANLATPWIRFSDRSPSDDYFVEVEQDRVRLRTKVPAYPAHGTLEYWRLERSGRRQLRFAEHGSGPSCNQCHLQSRSQTIDRVTEEVKGGVDLHLGPVDVVFEQLVRQFRDREPTPVDPFTSFGTRRAAGSYQHDEAPDSRLLASSFKLHTSLAGGVVGAADFTVGKRENRSDLADVGPVTAETDFRKAAGDLTIAPSAGWTLVLRYRLLDQDSSNSGALSSQGQLPSPVEVRDGIDLTRASYEARLSWRPSRHLTLQGEYEGKQIHRGNTGAAASLLIDPVWELPQDEESSRYRFSLLSRPLGTARLKLHAWYQYATSDDPAYAAAAEASHSAFAGLTFAPSLRWGLMASLKASEESNDGQRLVQFDSGTPVTFALDRDREQQELAVGFWLNPQPSLGLGLNYGFLRSRTIQDLLFGSSPSRSTASRDFTIVDEHADYSQQVQTLSAYLNWRLLEHLKALAEVYHTRSSVRFSPDFSRTGLDFTSFVGLVDVDASLLREISRLELRQNGLRLGLDWSPTPVWTCSARYTFDDYEDRNDSLFDGSAQTCMVSVARSW